MIIIQVLGHLPPDQMEMFYTNPRFKGLKVSDIYYPSMQFDYEEHICRLTYRQQYSDQVVSIDTFVNATLFSAKFFHDFMVRTLHPVYIKEYCYSVLDISARPLTNASVKSIG